MRQGGEVAADHLRAAAIERILHDPEAFQIDEENPVDAAKPTVPVLKPPVLPAFGRRAGHILDHFGVAGAKPDRRTARIARRVIGRGLADQFGCRAAIGREQQSG